MCIVAWESQKLLEGCTCEWHSHSAEVHCVQTVELRCAQVWCEASAMRSMGAAGQRKARSVRSQGGNAHLASRDEAKDSIVTQRVTTVRVTTVL